MCWGAKLLLDPKTTIPDAFYDMMTKLHICRTEYNGKMVREVKVFDVETVSREDGSILLISPASMPANMPVLTALCVIDARGNVIGRAARVAV
ncbi:MAG: hypothetical protein BWY68_00767 [bacterium ADurb.Bin400]|nr:MAG: hypothetical protein BWY68_00767 [bacterium ADurb.Bin400]